MPAPDAVRVSADAATPMGAVVRRLAVSVASSADLGIDRLGDVAVAVDQAFETVTSGEHARSIEATLQPGERTITICVAARRSQAVLHDSASAPEDDATPWSPDAWSDRVLRAVTDQVTYADRPRSVTFSISAT